MKRRFAQGALILQLALWPLAALSQQATGDGDIIVENLWARATTPGNKAAAVYLTIRNTGQNQIDLIGVRTDRASIETLHKTTTDAQGSVRMSALANLWIAPGESVTFEPGGLHVMLLDLDTPLIEGETLPLRLKFYDGDDLTVIVPILPSDATGPQP